MKARTILAAMTVVAMTASAETYTDLDTGVVWTYVTNGGTTPKPRPSCSRSVPTGLRDMGGGALDR